MLSNDIMALVFWSNKKPIHLKDQCMDYLGGFQTRVF